MGEDGRAEFFREGAWGEQVDGDAEGGLQFVGDGAEVGEGHAGRGVDEQVEVGAVGIVAGDGGAEDADIEAAMGGDDAAEALESARPIPRKIPRRP